MVRVRMAPSPTGFLHIGNVRTALFNWLFARHEGGEFRLRIENTDTSREVAEATQQIQDSLRWLGLDWDGEVTFQLDRMDDCRELAQKLLQDDKAYEDAGAVRFRMPDEGVTDWDDVVRGRVEFPNEKLEDLVLVRSDGRPTYNFASPMEDVWDGITHVIRGEDHISNTPKQINIIRAIGAEPPVYAHVSHVELIERFTLERVVPSPATFDYEKLDWMNGVYLRALPPEQYADELVRRLRDEGYDWNEELVRRAAPLVQEKIERFGQFPEFAGFLFREVEPDPALLDGDAPVVAAARDELAAVEPFRAAEIEAALRGLADRLQLSPRKAFQPIRIAVTGSKVSPGLFESLELLGREEALKRLSSAAGA